MGLETHWTQNEKGTRAVSLFRDSLPFSLSGSGVMESLFIYDSGMKKQIPDNFSVLVNKNIPIDA